MNHRNDVFWTSTVIATLVALAHGSVVALIDICEREGLWTIRFRLALYEHLWWTGMTATLVASLGTMIMSLLVGVSNDVIIILLSTASSIAVFRYAWPAWRNRHYCANRWAAWTGYSRTGIDARYVPYIEGVEKWRVLHQNIPTKEMHAVDKQLNWLTGDASTLIDSDPTDLLKVAHSSTIVTSPNLPGHHTSVTFSIEKSTEAEISEKGLSSQKSDIPTGLYAPIHDGKSASLLWGLDLGFRPRVSRAVLSVPSRLLTSYPRTSAGHDGRALCLAQGILGRNKGLAPWTFILSLNISKFEEKGVQWPRPSKVLRSYFEEEMKSVYGGLGDNFVTVATQLALLLADSSHSLIADWLAGGLEHQDYPLNRQAYELGASPEDLEILYRLSYAAMLVSLSTHRLGRRMRPEMTIFTTYWLTHESTPLPKWASGPEMERRRNEERNGIPGNADLDGLIAAVLSF